MEKKSRPGFVEFLNIVILIALGLPALSAVTLRTQGQQGQSSQVRVKRQDEGGLDDESKALVCDFGKGPSELDICGWVHSDDVHANVRWRSGHGSLAYWLGGPMVDKSENDENGGYVYFETSYKAVNRVYSSAALESASNYERFQVINETTNYNHSQQPKLQSEPSKASFHPFKSSLSMANVELEPLLVIPNKAHLLSPNVSQTGPQGTCLNFYYNMDGLSAEKLRVLVKDMDSDINQTLWETGTETEGKWIRAAIVYAYETSHQIILEGVAKNVDEPERAYRGYVAIDDLQFAPMGEGTEQDACHGHCTFEGGTCGWTNQEEGDDFDWTLARGSDNFFTGPARDYWSFSKEYPLGGFIYIDASYPRRPGDRSLLVSPKFEATGENEAICFKFATHMYGNGVGSLRVWYRPQDTASGQEEVVNEKILWEMSGESGNHWNLAQLPIASSSAFQIVFEGIVGSNYLGNIAIDSVSIEQGSCPISPQTASRDSGDCTFEENMCYWTSPLTDAHLDDFDWIRQFSYGNFLPKRDNSRKTSYGYFMSLNGDHLQQRRGGTYAWLLSGEFPPQGSFAKCMSFYYFMYQRIIHTGGPSLGGLRVYIRTTDQNGNVILLPVWRLNNHQSMKWRKARLPLVGLPSHQANGDVGHQRKPPGNPYQVVIEGIWGDARVGSIAIDDISFVDGDCSTTPPNAQAVYGECSFDRNLCGWRNHSKLAIKPQNQLSSSLGPPNKFTSVLSPTGRSQPPSGPLGHRLNPVVESSTWRLATPASRPTNMHDHTFRAPVGYVFFEVFNQNSAQTPVLQSRKFPAKDGDVSSKCLSFWFAAIGRSDSTQLSIYQLNEGEGAQSDADIGEAAPKDTSAGAPETGNRIQLWSIQTRKLDTRRPQWYYGQVTINAETAHQISFEGEALDGGFALDDITFYEGTCQTRPKEAAVITTKPDGE